jgi:O-antigen ligase
MELIFLILALAGTVWATLFIVRGSLWAGCVAFLVTGYCLGHAFLRFTIGPFPMTLDRFVFAGLLLAYIVQRRLGRAVPKPLGGADVLMLLFGGLLVVSTFTHAWQLDEPGKISPLWRLVAGYLIPIGIYWIARQSAPDPRSLRVVYGLLALLGVYAAVTALAEVTQQWWLVYPSYIADASRGIHFGRARGPTLQAQSLGFYLNSLLLCLWAWRPSLGRLGQAFLLLLAPVFLAAIAATCTRCAWLGLAAEATIVLGLSLPKPWRRLLLVAAAGSVLAAFVLLDQIVNIQRDAGAAASRASVESRGSFAYITWKMFLDHPLLGVGYGQYTARANDYLADRSVPMELEAVRGQPNHNTFFSLLTETGLIGVGLFTAMLLGWTRCAWQLWRRLDVPAWARRQGLLLLGAIGSFAALAMFFDTTFSPEDHWMIFFLAGLTVGIERAERLVPAPTMLCCSRLRLPQSILTRSASEVTT